MKHLISILAVLCLVVPAMGQMVAGDKSFSLSATGSGDHDFSNASISGDMRVSFMATDWLKLSLTQAVEYERANNGGLLSGATGVAADYIFTIDKVQLGFGIFGAGEYGGHNGIILGAEATQEFWLTKEVGLWLREAGQVEAANFAGLSDGFDRRTYPLSAGIEWKF